MAISHLLQDFNATLAGAGLLHRLSDEALEDQRLASFETGYAAGWEDALAAQSRGQEQFAGALADTLEVSAFTYHEALAQMIASVEPVFRCLLDAALPDWMMQALGQKIAGHLTEMARDAAGQPVTVTVPPGFVSAVKPALSEFAATPVEYLEDASLSPGQAILGVGANEREIDDRAVLRDVNDIVTAFFDETRKEIGHG